MISKPALINKYYDEYVKEKFGSNINLYNFFKNHERRHVLVKNLSKELFEVELSGSIKIDEKGLREMIMGLVKQFCVLAMNTEEKKAQESKRVRDSLLDEYGEVKEAIDLKPELPEGVVEVERPSNFQVNSTKS